MRRAASWPLFALLAMLAACTTAPPTFTSVTSWNQQRQALLAQRQFAFAGRVAVAANGEGFSAGIEWQQRAELSDLRLRGPLGLALVQVQYDGRTLLLQQPDGAPLTGAVAQAALHQALGFDVPLASLAYWVRGCDDPATAAETSFDEQNRLATLKQQGWQLSYEAYQREGALWLPQRLTLQRDSVRLRLVIQSWALGG